jgi:hypothetical protein
MQSQDASRDKTRKEQRSVEPDHDRVIRTHDTSLSEHDMPLHGPVVAQGSPDSQFSLFTQFGPPVAL